MAVPNYVKFLRGTVAAYNRLAVKDDNTLYFVYQDGNDTRGKLYLGSRLISGDVGSGSTTLADLTDVIVDGAEAGSFLVLNSDGNWIATSASDIAQTILEAGGNFVTIDEQEFQFNSVSGKLELKGYASASTGMMPVKGNNGIEWHAAPSNLDSRVGTLEGKVSTLETDFQSIDGRISNAIANASHLTYQVVESLDDAINENVVYLHSNNTESTIDRYKEFMVVNGQLEQIGSLSVDLSNYVTVGDLNTALANKVDNSTFSTFTTNLNSTLTSINNTLNNLDNNYVTKTTFNTTVGDLSALSSYNELEDVSIADNLADIYERLMWQDISV